MLTVLDQRTSRSIHRYTNLIVDTLHATCITLPNRKFKSLIYFQKYVWLPFKLALSFEKSILLPSENYAYLLPFLIHKHTIIVCHDLHDLMNKDVANWRKCLLKGNLKGLRFANQIVCISEHTKQDLLRVVHKNIAAKIKVIHNPIEPFWFENVQRPIVKFDTITDKYILLVGTNAWYKNLNFSLEALLHVDCQIVKVGDLDPIWKDKFDSDKLIHFDNVSDKQLQWLYQNAQLFVFPSIHEGFGWPVLEAMASGCPVLASDKASIKEIGKDFIIYFDPYNVEDFMFKLNKVLSIDATKNTVVDEAIQRSYEFSTIEFLNDFKKLYT